MNKNVFLVFPKTGLDLKRVNIQMPMGLLCVAAPLVEKGYNVALLDQRTESSFFEKILGFLKEKPLCVGMSVMTGWQILYALEIARFIRKHSQVPIIWGGVHPTLMADQTVRNENIDIVVRGEGDETFLELTEALCFQKPLDRIKGISWKQGETVQHNPEREFCDLNRLCPVPYRLLNVERYILSQMPGRSRSLDIYTSRGCPHKCVFCYNGSYNKAAYRTKNIGSVIQEIEELVKNYRLDSVYINDDNFFVDIERSHDFCRALIQRKIVPEWGCQGVRVDSLEKTDFDLLEESGCKHLYVGIESGSEDILKEIKKDISLEQIKSVVKKFARSKIIAHYNFMIGYPTEDAAKLDQTLALADFIMQTDPKAYFSSFHLITPYPGTEFYEIARQYGFRVPARLEEWADVRWEFEHAPWVNESMRKIDLNLTLLTYFIDRKGLDKTRHNPLLFALTKILTLLAKFRWKHRMFERCPEFRLLQHFVNKRVHKELSGLKRRCQLHEF